MRKIPVIIYDVETGAENQEDSIREASRIYRISPRKILRSIYDREKVLIDGREVYFRLAGNNGERIIVRRVDEGDRERVRRYTIVR